MIKKALTGRKGNLMSIHELDAKVRICGSFAISRRRSKRRSPSLKMN